MRAEQVRSEVQRLLRQVPFRGFVLNFENGDGIPIQDPENIAFDPGDNSGSASVDFYVVSGRYRLHSTFEAVTSVGTTESMEQLG